MKFLHQLVAGGFLMKKRRVLSLPIIIHDDSTLILMPTTMNEYLQWGTSESQLIRPKSRGSGIMVSDFITEKDGFLQLTEEEYQAAKELDQS